jgi:hypothetical protein
MRKQQTPAPQPPVKIPVTKLLLPATGISLYRSASRNIPIGMTAINKTVPRKLKISSLSDEKRKRLYSLFKIPD